MLTKALFSQNSLILNGLQVIFTLKLVKFTIILEKIKRLNDESKMKRFIKVIKRVTLG